MTERKLRYLLSVPVYSYKMFVRHRLVCILSSNIYIPWILSHIDSSLVVCLCILSGCSCILNACRVSYIYIYYKLFRGCLGFRKLSNCDLIWSLIESLSDTKTDQLHMALFLTSHKNMEFEHICFGFKDQFRTFCFQKRHQSFMTLNTKSMTHVFQY